MVPSGRCFSKRFGCGRTLKVPWAVRLRCLLEHHVGTRATIFAASVSLLSRRPGHATALTWPDATSINANTTPQAVMALAHSVFLMVALTVVLLTERAPGPNPDRRAGRPLESVVLAALAVGVGTWAAFGGGHLL
jgi:hypothetical protein